MIGTINTREDQFEFIRQYINSKIDKGPKGLVMLVGDLNVNSSKPNNAFDAIKKELNDKLMGISPHNYKIMEKVENEYESL